MRLTVVGCSPAWPNPGGAHSGYLVEGTGRLLVDLGPGVLGKLRERNGHWPHVDSIVISHWHLDHWGDLVPWVWGHLFSTDRNTDAPEVWVPPGGVEQLARFGQEFGTPSMFADTFPLREYAEEPFETAAGLTVRPFQVPHYRIRTYAFRITDGERTLAYSSDSAPSDALADLAREADLFLCEATLESSASDTEPRGHLAVDEAVAAFEASGARSLLLTHRPLELAVPGGLQLAQEGMVLDL